MAARKKNLSNADIDAAVAMYESGVVSAEVAKALNFNDREVKKALADRGVLRRGPFRIKWVDDEHIECSKCHEVKHVDDIVHNTNNTQHKSGSYLSYCKMCRATQQANARNGKPVPWNTRLTRLRARCKKYGIACTLTLEDLENLWGKQSGRCMYTNEQMLDAQGYGKHPLAVSIDKVEPHKGYVPGNVVLCTARANTIKYNQTLEELKEWMPLWYSRLMDNELVWKVTNKR